MKTGMLCALMATLLAAGCATPPRHAMTFSVEELGAEGLSRKDDQLEYRSALNITGISQPYAAGKQISVPGRELPEILSVPISTLCSRIIESLYESDATAADVGTLGLAVQQLRTALAQKATLLLKEELFARSARQLESAGAGAAEDALYKRLASALGFEAPPDKAALDKARAANAAAILAAQQAADEEQGKIKKLGTRPNMVVTRWSFKGSEAANLGIGAVFGLGTSGSESRTGYLVMAHIRTAALEYGDDVRTMLVRHWTSGRSGSDAILSNTFITNFTLAARYHYFSQDVDLSRSISASLKLGAAELDQIFGGSFTAFIKAQSLAIDAALARTLAASAYGLVAGPKRREYEFRLAGDTTLELGGRAERARNDGFTVLYSSRASLPDLPRNEVLMKQPEAFNCMHSVPRAGKLRGRTPPQIGYEVCLPLGWDTREGQEALGAQSPLDWVPDTTQCIRLDQPA